MNDPRETQISTADLMHLHLRHPTMSMRFCYACRYISGRSLNLGKITSHSCTVLKRLESFSPGFSGIILRFYTDLSLTLNELFWFPQFQQHINNGISYIQHPSYKHEPYFGVIDCQEVRNECKKNNVQFESVQYFVPFVCVTWLNGKRRFSLAVQQEGPARIPAEGDWKTPPMNDALMLEHLRHNGAIRGTNIFFRAQSGHSNIKRTQRLGVEYDFRHNFFSGFSHRSPVLVLVR